MFVVGQVYKRSDLHDKYGGNRQRGISPSGKADLIFLFTGSSGKDHGYEDGWKSNDVFYYTGEGQKGDMTFKMGNRAIRDHFSEGKSLFLFEQFGNGYVKYLGEMKCIGHQEKDGFDGMNNRRKIIVFTLKQISSVETNDVKLFEESCHDTACFKIREQKLQYLLAKVTNSQMDAHKKKKF